ncbi:hypothetical protein CEUSTIGMA_g6316.t1 [Chlamydomonas eustigma]|uniref:Uncharacterized protein n=1 Tax=Chlamydomonas eustigma TaxID=1157962 RepID=A0A250X727_9CHLO|nr:hypothetical protein CEUSTIGMA_g6316.t1 [Chlamydomonas eustigma]|eukprot:GAX78877.1 hypothetical protein CEUSTIGMA_g6316.t1 [Chlamydomonas eustigma]
MPTAKKGWNSGTKSKPGFKSAKVPEGLRRIGGGFIEAENSDEGKAVKLGSGVTNSFCDQTSQLAPAIMAPAHHNQLDARPPAINEERAIIDATLIMQLQKVNPYDEWPKSGHTQHQGEIGSDNVATAPSDINQIGIHVQSQTGDSNLHPGSQDSMQKDQCADAEALNASFGTDATAMHLGPQIMSAMQSHAALGGIAVLGGEEAAAQLLLGTKVVRIAVIQDDSTRSSIQDILDAVRHAASAKKSGGSRSLLMHDQAPQGWVGSPTKSLLLTLPGTAKKHNSVAPADNSMDAVGINKHSAKGMSLPGHSPEREVLFRGCGQCILM